MFKMFPIKICFLFFCIFTISSAKILLSDNATDNKQNFTGETTPLQDERRYVKGNRVPGDAVVGHTSKNQRYPTFQNVKVDLRYPASGYGKMITYVEIAVNQTSTQGYAQITQGDVGQHFIAISVYATNTYQMDYSAIIYGI